MKAQIARGAAWVFLLRMVDRSLGLISILVLARLLVPADFGLVAMATSVSAVVELLTAFGFELALIQKPKPTRADYDTAWTLNLGLAAGCALVVLALAYPTALFYEDPRLVAVMAGLAACQLVAGAGNIGTVNFRREMNFSRDFRFMATKRVSGFLVTIAVALAFQSYWALIAGTFASRVCGVVASFVMHPYRPRLCFESARELIRFSKWNLLSNATIAGIQRLPHFVAGRMFGPGVLGVYVISYELGTLAATELAAPVNRAALPGYSKLASSAGDFRSAFLDIGSLVLLIALPLGIGMAALAEPLVALLLGAKWQAAVPYVQILSIAGALTAATANNGVALIASGYPAGSSVVLLIRLGVLTVALAAFVHIAGPLGLAWAELLATAIAFVASCGMAFRRLGVAAKEFVSRNWRSVAACLVMATCVRSLLPYFDSTGTWPSMKTLLFLSPVGALVYLGCVALLWMACGRPPGCESIVLSKARPFLGRVFRARG